MCLTNEQKKIDEKTERDAMALLVVVICAFTLLGAVIGFIGGYSACKVATAEQVQVD